MENNVYNTINDDLNENYSYVHKLYSLINGKSNEELEQMENDYYSKKLSSFDDLHKIKFEIINIQDQLSKTDLSDDNKERIERGILSLSTLSKTVSNGDSSDIIFLKKKVLELQIALSMPVTFYTAIKSLYDDIISRMTSENNTKKSTDLNGQARN